MVMMLSLWKPSAECTRRFLSAQAKLDFSYSGVGATASQLPVGFALDHTRTKLGDGELVFEAARVALQQWKQFDLGWLEVWPPETPIKTGEVVAFVARAMGLWWQNVCKIVYVVDEAGPISQFGLAYGTLPGHTGTGEERFLIEWDRADNSVWYDILAFSRPNHFLARLGYPIVRRTQKRFGRESAAAMRNAVRSNDVVRSIDSFLN